MNKHSCLCSETQPWRLIIFSMLGLSLFSNPGGAADTILSKDHAAAIFAMDKGQWNASLRKAGTTEDVQENLNAQGVARMELEYSTGAFLYVVPEFDKSNDNPSRINVTLAMPTPMSLMFDETTIYEITGRAKLEMLPEYDVSTDHATVGGGVALFFVIVEN